MHSLDVLKSGGYPPEFPRREAEPRREGCARPPIRKGVLHGRALFAWPWRPRAGVAPDSLKRRRIGPASRAAFAISLAFTAANASDPLIEFDRSANPPIFRVVEVEDLPGLVRDIQSFTAAQWQAIFAVYATPRGAESQSANPAVMGSYRADGRGIVFQPRFGVQDGMRYRAVYRPAGNSPPLERIFETAVRDMTPTTEVTRVYPSADLLPENQLKFYLHFSAPMSFGEAYRRVHLLDEKGEEIDLPFLEIDQELWDPGRRRLTVFFDPGRVKSGLVPNLEEGLPILEGHSYTLLVDDEWLDAEGRRLKGEFRKRFRVGPADREPPNLANWKVVPPVAGSREPLEAKFPEPLDRALLDHLIGVATTERKPIGGAIEVSEHETRWRFTPQAPWRGGSYILEVGTALEDLAGNSIGRPFEVDVFEKVEERVSRVTEQLRFQVEPPAAPVP